MEENNRITSKITVSAEKMANDLSLVSYYSSYRILLLLILMSAVVSVAGAFSKYGNYNYLLFCWVSIVAVILFVKIKSYIKLSIKRTNVSRKKSGIEYTVEFDQKIHLSSENSKSATEYDYTEIKSIRAAGDTLWLELDGRLYFPVSGADRDIVLPLLLERCTNMKKKKVIDLTSSKKIFMGLMIASIVISAVCLIYLIYFPFFSIRSMQTYI